MDFADLPQPWGTILELIVGPVGAIVVLCLVIFFVWKLFREEQVERRKSLETVSTLTQTVRDLANELRAWREATK